MGMGMGRWGGMMVLGLCCNYGDVQRGCWGGLSFGGFTRWVKLGLPL